MQQWLDDGHGEDSIQWAVLMWYKLMEQQYDKAKRCALIVFRDTAREQLLLWAWTQRFLRQAIQDPCSEWPDYDFEVRPQLVARIRMTRTSNCGSTMALAHSWRTWMCQALRIWTIARYTQTCRETRCFYIE
jgi:hypothetical protein